MEKNTTILKHLPNFITSLNILAGSFAIVIAFEMPEKMVYSTALIGLAAIFDFFDGFTARLLKAYSAIGKDLDSLADMISFGFAPATIMYQLQKMALINEGDFCFCKLNSVEIILIFSAYLIAVFSGLRLAKFNNDTRQTESFIGLATPANSIFIASLPLLLHFYPTNTFYADLILNPYTLLAVTIIMSFLLVSELPMFSLKFKNFKLADNAIRYILIITVLLLILFFGWLGITLLIPVYIILSLINSYAKRSS